MKINSGSLQTAKMSMIQIDIGRIRTSMADKGLTIEATAELIGITRGSFDRILQRGWCQAFMMGRIARVLGIPVWELVV